MALDLGLQTSLPKTVAGNGKGVSQGALVPAVKQSRSVRGLGSRRRGKSQSSLHAQSANRVGQAELPLVHGRQLNRCRARLEVAAKASKSSGAAAAAAAATETEAVDALPSKGQDEAPKEQDEEPKERKTEAPKAKPDLIAYDYGFQAEFLREGPTVPGNVIKLALENFGREYKALRRNLLFEELSDLSKDNVQRTPAGLALAYLGRFTVTSLRFFDRLLTLYDGLPEVKPSKPLAPESEDLRQKLKQLTLSNDAVWEREHSRQQVEAPFWILGPYYALCLMLDVIFNNRPIQRFWFLETVARMPYFSYISMLHLYESLGWWRVGSEVRKVHFAEEWNEMHHLRIMESLGGDRLWVDRFFGQHAAVFYYWVLNIMFLISPRVAYNFSELIEFHAVDTYGQFVDENEELLKSLPPPSVAINYYYNEDLYMFDEFQTSRLPNSRRPKIESLYDVFSAIRDDEMEHVKTMSACQDLQIPVKSPNRVKAELEAQENVENEAKEQETIGNGATMEEVDAKNEKKSGFPWNLF